MRSETERKRELLRSKIALQRIRQSNDAISEIIEILAGLPDLAMRRSVITYLHENLNKDSA